jgi:hypothetical protein
MAERDSHDEQLDPQDEAQGEKPSRGYRIPGRDFANTSFAADQEEQTATHRGDAGRTRMDDQGSGDHPDIPRDES